VLVALLAFAYWQFGRESGSDSGPSTQQTEAPTQSDQAESDQAESDAMRADEMRAEKAQPESASSETQTEAVDTGDSTQASGEETEGAPAKPTVDDGAATTPDTPGERPSFDVVRVERSGETVIAGRAAPDTEVTVTLDGKPYARVRSDKRGEWVVVGEDPLPPGDHELSLESEDGAGHELDSKTVVVVSVPHPQIAGGEAAQGSGAATADGEETAGEEPLVVLMQREGGAVERVLQGPQAGITVGELSLDAVTYDDLGRLTVTGRVSPKAQVYVYVDNGFYGDARGGEDGAWRYRGSVAIEKGLHRLRVDQVDMSGKVLARVETPFMRVDMLAEGAPDDRFVIVQPGNSLWRIARRSYGEGTQYSLLFQANRDQISDPDLIYPGQIFVVPKLN
jgi:nucleoid-associated protein YgaU